MHVISFVNQKGGTGKSLLALNLAVTAEAAGEQVCLIDLDPQSTVAHWYETRTVETPAVLDHDQAEDLPEALARLAASGFTLAVIDTMGVDSHATRAAMQAADLNLVPVRPAGPDLHASRPTVEALRAMGRGFALVINQATPNKAAKITAAVTARLAHDGPVLPVAIAARVELQYAYALGQGASEYAPAGKSAAEIQELWAWCRKRLARNGEVDHGQEKRSA